jgi:aspartate kinase
LIVMKFGGSSVGDADRIANVAGLVAERASARPLVVVSALAGVTDLLTRAVDAAGAGDLDRLEPVVAEIERRHRWALAAVRDDRRRHDLGLDVDRMLEELRGRLRSIRVLGEATPRATDAVLASGEDLSSRIVVGAFADRGLAARWVDPRSVVCTDESFGTAEADERSVREACAAVLRPILDAGEVPVIGGFVGATAAGETTTLGRGGSDTSATVLGLGLAADEIQIWTDVDGLMTADPRLVPLARTLDRVSFAEAAELAFYGAKVLHPASIAPAVRRRIPVRVLNSLRPTSAGTAVVEDAGEAELPAAVASRGGMRLVRVTNRRMRMERGFVPAVLAAAARAGADPDLLVSSEVGLTLAVRGRSDASAIEAAGEGEWRAEVEAERALVCVVGSALASSPPLRARVLDAFAALEPDVVALGASGTSASAVLPEARLGTALAALHARFFEGGEP